MLVIELCDLLTNLPLANHSRICVKFTTKFSKKIFKTFFKKSTPSYIGKLSRKLPQGSRFRAFLVRRTCRGVADHAGRPEEGPQLPRRHRLARQQRDELAPGTDVVNRNFGQKIQIIMKTFSANFRPYKQARIKLTIEK
jgi:hypothetical protein